MWDRLPPSLEAQDIPLLMIAILDGITFRRPWIVDRNTSKKKAGGPKLSAPVAAAAGPVRAYFHVCRDGVDGMEAAAEEDMEGGALTSAMDRMRLHLGLLLTKHMCMQRSNPVLHLLLPCWLAICRAWLSHRGKKRGRVSATASFRFGLFVCLFAECFGFVGFVGKGAPM